MELRILQIVYVSTASSDISAAVLDAIGRTSVRNNAFAAVTGVLLHRDGRFVQLLEGLPDAVEAIYDAIKADDRHHSCTIVIHRSADARSAPHWTMATLDLGASEAHTREGRRARPRGASRHAHRPARRG